MNTVFKPENVIQRINEVKELIEPEMPDHIARWKIHGVSRLANLFAGSNDVKKHIIFRIILLTAMVCLLVSPALLAQQHERPTPENRVEVINKAVKLTADQQAQILKIYTDAAANVQQGGRVVSSAEEPQKLLKRF